MPGTKEGSHLLWPSQANRRSTFQRRLKRRRLHPSWFCAACDCGGGAQSSQCPQRRVDVDWKTSAICHCHDLRTFAPHGLSLSFTSGMGRKEHDQLWEGRHHLFEAMRRNHPCETYLIIAEAARWFVWSCG